jgi:hypothetical protein
MKQNKMGWKHEGYDSPLCSFLWMICEFHLITLCEFCEVSEGNFVGNRDVSTGPEDWWVDFRKDPIKSRASNKRTYQAKKKTKNTIGRESQCICGTKVKTLRGTPCIQYKASRILKITSANYISFRLAYDSAKKHKIEKKTSLQCQSDCQWVWYFFSNKIFLT